MKKMMFQVLTSEKGQKAARWATIGLAIFGLFAGPALSTNSEGPIIPW